MFKKRPKVCSRVGGNSGRPRYYDIDLRVPLQCRRNASKRVRIYRFDIRARLTPKSSRRRRPPVAGPRRGMTEMRVVLFGSL